MIKLKHGAFIFSFFWILSLTLSLYIIGGIQSFFKIFIPLFFSVCILLQLIIIYSINFKFKQIFIFIFSILFAIFHYAFWSILLYYVNTHSSISYTDIEAICQTTLDEGLAFIFESAKNNQLFIFSYISPILTAITFFSVYKASKNIKIKSTFKFISFIILIIGSCFLFTQIEAVKFSLIKYEQYHTNIQNFKHFAEKISKTKVTANKKELGELHVIIIGESESRDFTGQSKLFQNTPWRESLINDKNWFSFSNAYSHHTHTVPVLTAALTDGRQSTGLAYPMSTTLIQIAQAANINTHWISNQYYMGPWDTPISALAHQAKNVKFFNFGDYLKSIKIPDDILLPEIRKTLQQIKPNENNLLIVHLLGSHSRYSDRFPKDFPSYELKDKGNVGKIFDDKVLMEEMSTYLTSIKHTDFVLSEIFKAVEQYSHIPTTFLYFADHGDDIFVRNGPHNFTNFTWTMSRIPMLLYLSPAYQDKYKDKVQSLSANVDKVFSNDLIYDLSIGLQHINTPTYDSRFDISSNEYDLNFDNAAITEYKKIAEDPMLVALKNASDDGKLLGMHRANTTFKANQGLSLGIMNLEIDLIFMTNNGKKELILGHDKPTLTGMPLHIYLSALIKKPNFLWLDIKNMEEANKHDILAYLESIDATYGLKHIALIESSNFKALELFSNNKWQTSYYLPWQAIMKSFEKGEEKLFYDIARRVSDNKIRGVSYDVKADYVIKNKILPMLPHDIKAYGWTFNTNFHDKNIYTKTWHYNHLDKLLVPFESPYGI